MVIKKIMLTIDEEIVKDIDEKAKLDGRSRNNYITRIIVERFQFEEREKEYKDEIDRLKDQIKLLGSIPKQQIVEPIIIKEEVKSGFTKSSKILDEIPEL